MCMTPGGLSPGEPISMDLVGPAARNRRFPVKPTIATTRGADVTIEAPIAKRHDDSRNRQKVNGSTPNGDDNITIVTYVNLS